MQFYNFLKRFLNNNQKNSGAFLLRDFRTFAVYFPHSPYCSSVTGSSHSLEVFSPGTSTAR